MPFYKIGRKKFAFLTIIIYYDRLINHYAEIMRVIGRQFAACHKDIMAINAYSSLGIYYSDLFFFGKRQSVGQLFCSLLYYPVFCLEVSGEKLSLLEFSHVLNWGYLLLLGNRPDNKLAIMKLEKRI